VCPIGIDIREGPNFACINCGLCVDACDGVMSKLGRPRGLIDYESWDNIERGRRAEPLVARLVRPKTVGLTAACLVLAAAIVLSFMARTSATLSIQHDRDPLAVRLSDGSVGNAYTVKLLNKSSVAHAYTLSVSGVDARMTIIGNERLAPIEVPADGSEAVRVTLTAMSPREAELVFTARDESTTILSAKDRFVER
jgi:polyferredoxin